MILVSKRIYKNHCNFAFAFTGGNFSACQVERFKRRYGCHGTKQQQRIGMKN